MGFIIYLFSFGMFCSNFSHLGCALMVPFFMWENIIPLYWYITFPQCLTNLHSCKQFKWFLHFTLQFFSVCNICHDNRRSNWSKIKSQLILISVFFIAKDVEYFSTYLLVLCISGENCKFNSLAYLLIKLFVLLLFNI